MQLYVTHGNIPLDSFAPASGTSRPTAPLAPLAPQRPTFEALFACYEQPVYRFVRSLIGDAEDARDLTQDTFLKVYRALPRLRPHHTRAWVFRIATNVCLDQLRRRRTVRWQSLDALLETGPVGEHTVEGAARRPWKNGPRVAPAGTDPVERVLCGELTERALAILDGLRQEHRTALLLRAYGGLSYPEIARAMATTRGAVKAQLRRARQEFRLAWEEVPVDPAGGNGATQTVPLYPPPAGRLAPAGPLPVAA